MSDSKILNFKYILVKWFILTHYVITPINNIFSGFSLFKEQMDDSLLSNFALA